MLYQAGKDLWEEVEWDGAGEGGVAGGLHNP